MSDYRIALRPDETGKLDDVVIRDIKMFRLEQMDHDTWFMCCHLDESVERVAFWISRRGKDVDISVTELPDLNAIYEPGSMGLST